LESTSGSDLSRHPAAFESWMRTAPLAVVVLDQEERVRFWNTAAERLFGWRQDEVLGKLYPAVPVEKEGESSQLHQSSLSGKAVARVEMRRRHRDGSTLHLSVSCNPLPGEDGQIVDVMLLIANVTEKVQAEQALRDSEERYRNLVENSPALICLHKLDGTLISVNPAAAHSLGYQVEDAPGRNIREFMVPEHTTDFAPYAAQLEITGEASGETHVLTRFGDPRIWSFHNRMLRPPGQEPYVLGLAIDVTERHRAHAEREQLIAELQEALLTVNTLTGILPICAACKKIRDDRGEWTPVEVYVRERSQAQFSHGICPECAASLYPDNQKK